MPSIVTHYLFSEEVLSNTKKEIQNDLSTSKEIYHIFAQSFDNLFYYNLLTPLPGKKIRNLGYQAQKIKTSLYFKNLIQTIQEKKLQNKSDVLAYLYGSLTHYILDSNCHPFVIYHSGWIEMDEKNSIYRGNHEKLEVSIDAILYEEKKHQKLHQANLGDILLPKIKFSKELKNVISETFEKTFEQTNMGNIYEKSTNQGHYILKYLVTDHHGIKKTGYKIFDQIFTHNRTKYQNLSFYIKEPKIEFLNRTHELWSNPVDNTLKSNDSFDDLYQKALKETLEIFDLTNKVIHNQIQINDYLKILGNKSYTTGLDWNLKLPYQYFNTKNFE